MTNHLFQRIRQAAEGHESHKLLEPRLVGEAVAAIVVPAKGALFDESSVQEALAKKLAKFKLPKRLIFVEELPRNAMGTKKSFARKDWKFAYVRAGQPSLNLNSLSSMGRCATVYAGIKDGERTAEISIKAFRKALDKADAHK